MQYITLVKTTLYAKTPILTIHSITLYISDIYNIMFTLLSPDDCCMNLLNLRIN